MAQPDQGSAAEAPRDFTAELEESEARLAEAERYLGLDRLLERRAELEVEAAKPDLWNDGDSARAITTELGQVMADLDQLSGLRNDLSDASGVGGVGRRIAGGGITGRVVRIRTGDIR